MFGSRFIHLHITASGQVREQRYMSAKGEPAFVKADGQEVESKIDRLGEMAAVSIDNNDTLDELETALCRAVRAFAPQEFECLSRSL
jgi:hypothetical protein